ncbi:MAG: Rrf2 family transcriptional regulator [Planctomycetia bacterium]|nr:Rrf2 family transcriptional regulator [Planctomycetia bacterium]
MKVSAKAEYACLAVLDLASRRDLREPVQVAELAERNRIPERFLVQILLQLKGAGFVQSVRGAAGGYHLSVDPRELNLLDLVRLFDGPSVPGQADDMHEKSVGRQVLHAVWCEVTEKEEDLLRQAIVSRLAEAASRQDASMFYI